VESVSSLTESPSLFWNICSRHKWQRVDIITLGVSSPSVAQLELFYSRELKEEKVAIALLFSLNLKVLHSFSQTCTLLTSGCGRLER